MAVPLKIEWNQQIQKNGSGNGKPDHQKGFLSGPAPEHEDAQNQRHQVQRRAKVHIPHSVRQGAVDEKAQNPGGNHNGEPADSLGVPAEKCENGGKKRKSHPDHSVAFREKSGHIIAVQVVACHHPRKEGKDICAGLKRTGTFYGQKDGNHDPRGKGAQKVVQIQRCVDLLQNAGEGSLTIVQVFGKCAETRAQQQSSCDHEQFGLERRLCFRLSNTIQILHKELLTVMGKTNELGRGKELSVQRQLQGIILAVGVFPILGYGQKRLVTVGTDKFQRLAVLGIFIAGVLDKTLDGFAGRIFGAVCAGGVALSQTADFHFASGLPQIPGTIQVSQFAAFAGFPEFPAGFTVRPAAADFFCGIHGSLPSLTRKRSNNTQFFSFSLW